jgi:hypothetical protein
MNGTAAHPVASPDATTDPSSAFWQAVYDRLAAAPSLQAMQAHGVELLESHRRRVFGEHVPDELVTIERTANLVSLAAPAVLQRIRELHEGPLVLIKGPELALLYPGLARSFGDLDLIVDDARGLQDRLLAAGFIEINDPDRYVDIHHLRPVMWPALPIKIELHTRPKWPDGFTPPPTAEILEAAVPARSAPEGILTASPEHHAVMVAAHGWAHVPLRRLRDIIDTMVLAAIADERAADDLARRWEVDRIWHTTIRAGRELVAGESPSFPARTWARHLPKVRERTVLEAHLERLLSPFSSLPPGRALARTLREIRADFSPAEGETWADKGRRTVLAVRHAFTPRSKHDEALGEASTRHRS